MMLAWLFPKREAKIDPKKERERDIAGLRLQREGVLTASLSHQIQETLARGVVLELRR